MAGRASGRASLEELKERFKQDDQKRLREMEKHARCVLLPSPDILATSAFPGADKTDTLGDYADVLNWVITKNLLNTDFYKPEVVATISGKIEVSKEYYEYLVRLAFDNAFAPILHTGSLDSHELLLWYYAGHGLGNVNIKTDMKETSTKPRLDKVGLNMENHELAAEFMPEHSTRTVKGGELCLHHIGFCDLNGLLEPWIAALKGKSQNIHENEPHVKKNKHLVLILDSCYSGTFANDLIDLAQKQGPWKENGCSVTVQASCTAEEPTVGRYFTPLFLYLNQHRDYLDEFKQEWEKMKDKEKETFSSLPLPSPVVETTRDDEDNHHCIKKIKCQNVSIVLFPDAGFFKFCYERCFQKQNEGLRTLTSHSVERLLQQSSFIVLDYKLKKLSSSARHFANTPMGLFLVDTNTDSDPEHVVCVHIHFPLDDTTRVSRINLVHHLRPGPGGTIYEEERSSHIFQIDDTTTDEVNNLVTACYNAVENHEPGRWSNHSQWNMGNNELGVMSLFRLKARLENRSVDMSKYLQSIQDKDEDKDKDKDKDKCK